MSLVAPLAFVSPLIGGLLADSVSYRAVFLVSALAGAIGWAVLAAKVREPRHRSAFGV
jgi:MFS family permease